MKSNFLLNSTLGLGCAALILAVVFQAQTAAKLQTQERELRAQLSSQTVKATPSQNAETNRAERTVLTDKEVMELMRLRNETYQLRKQQQSLAVVAAENASLRAQQATNTTGGKGSLPVGYIRKSESQYMGLATPEATLQSLLHAMAKHDTNLLFQVLDGPVLESFRAGIQNQGVDKFWGEFDIMPGARVIKSTPRSDTEITLDVEFAPGMAQPMVFIRSGSEWKLSR